MGDAAAKVAHAGCAPAVEKDPFDKRAFDEPDIAKLTTNISQVYKDAGSSFEKLGEAEKNEIVATL